MSTREEKLDAMMQVSQHLASLHARLLKEHRQPTPDDGETLRHLEGRLASMRVVYDLAAAEAERRHKGFLTDLGAISAGGDLT